MSVMACTVTVAGFPAGVSADQVFDAVTGTLSAEGVDQLGARIDTRARHWLSTRLHDPVRVTALSRFCGALESTIVSAVEARAPGARVEVGWEPLEDRESASWDLAQQLGGYAEQFADLPDVDVLGPVSLALTDPARARELFPDWYEELPHLVVLAALLQSLAQAHVITAVDRRADRSDTASAVLDLVVLPEGRRTVADLIDAPEAFRRRGEDHDRQSYEVIVAETGRQLKPRGVVLVELRNGDTPLLLAARSAVAGRVAELAGLMTAAATC
jgi:hypothetical protein